MQTRVINCRVEKPGSNAVYIGRPGIWGNPFTHHAGETEADVVVATREEAVEAYEHYIRERLKREPGLLAELRKLKGKTLVCWCKPAPCHGDVLVKLINELWPDM